MHQKQPPANVARARTGFVAPAPAAATSPLSAAASTADNAPILLDTMASLASADERGSFLILYRLRARFCSLTPSPRRASVSKGNRRNFMASARPPQRRAGDIPRRVLGRTGVAVTATGLGRYHLGRRKAAGL